MLQQTSKSRSFETYLHFGAFRKRNRQLQIIRPNLRTISMLTTNFTTKRASKGSKGTKSHSPYFRKEPPQKLTHFPCKNRIVNEHWTFLHHVDSFSRSLAVDYAPSQNQDKPLAHIWMGTQSAERVTMLVNVCPLHKSTYCKAYKLLQLRLSVCSSSQCELFKFDPRQS